MFAGKGFTIFCGPYDSDSVNASFAPIAPTTAFQQSLLHTPQSLALPEAVLSITRFGERNSRVSPALSLGSYPE